MFKLSYTINPDGSVKYFYSKKFRPNLRGTVFPIPKFKGGKAKKDMILREDELLMGGRQHKWNWGKQKEALDPQTLE
eukprot:CAMPEP_0168315154 /NCGR_PEP_ID=MMETSP0210-20121227/10317_1 /TAXON_ID=40633 /ORGANISM="Condylostoma magnum, Strain COL2" /LENGTH=76 /DNA_ID=CAMNT_0008286747 /DNA_START=750 /DNA_END=980 /DNA_ORIENTATION=+